MPEGPECIRIAEGLCKVLLSQSIVAIEISLVETPRFFNGLEATLGNVVFPLSVDKVDCKGKQIYFHLKEATSGKKWYALSNLGMTGVWSLQREPHTHLELLLESGKSIYYCDARRIGNFRLLEDQTEFQSVLDSLAPSFLGDNPITLDTFTTNLRKCNKSYLAPCLTNQHKICSCIGNYLLSEIFYATRLHPEIRCNQLTDAQIQDLYHHTARIILASYQAGGMSMRDYKMVDGTKGTFVLQLQIYAKDTTPDGHIVKHEKGKHGSMQHWDPLVQVLP